MQFHADLISILLILALVVAVGAFATPQIVKVFSLQEQIQLQSANAQVEIAKKNAEAAAAPTLTAMDVAIKNQELISKTNAIENANALSKVQRDAIEVGALADADTKRRSADANAKLMEILGYGLSGLLCTGALGFWGYGLYRARSHHHVQKQTLLIEQGKIEIRKAEVEVLSKAVDVLGKSGGELILENGRVLRFQPKPEPIMIEANNDISRVKESVAAER